MGVTGLDELSHWPREVFKSQLLLWRTLETYLCSAVLFGWVFESVVSTDIRVVSHVFTQSDQIRLLSTWKKTTKTSLGQHAAMWELTGNKPACSQGENVTSLQRGELGKSDVKGWYREGNWWLSWEWLADGDRALPTTPGLEKPSNPDAAHGICSALPWCKASYNSDLWKGHVWHGHAWREVPHL